MSLTTNLPLPIGSNDDYEIVMARVDELMDLNDGEGPDRNTDEGMELEVLSMIVEIYEQQTWPMDLPSPLAAIAFVMEHRGYTQVDLSNVLHSRSRASELVNGRLTSLSRGMIQRLHAEWGIPADVLIQDFQPKDLVGT